MEFHSLISSWRREELFLQSRWNLWFWFPQHFIINLRLRIGSNLLLEPTVNMQLKAWTIWIHGTQCRSFSISSHVLCLGCNQARLRSTACLWLVCVYVCEICLQITCIFSASLFCSISASPFASATQRLRLILSCMSWCYGIFYHGFALQRYLRLWWWWVIPTSVLFILFVRILIKLILQLCANYASGFLIFKIVFIRYFGRGVKNF